MRFQFVFVMLEERKSISGLLEGGGKVKMPMSNGVTGKEWLEVFLAFVLECRLAY